MSRPVQPARIQGTITVPPSKSMAHRMMICAGLAAGTSRISGLRDSMDMQATLQCLEQLGARVDGAFPTLTITGTDPVSRSRSVLLDCNESGSTLRFLIPVAALSDQEAEFTGRGRLMERPMGLYADIFLNQGLRFEQGEGRILVQGPLQAGLFEVPGDVSSQFISGLLFAAPLMEGQTEIAVLPPYESRDYVKMTVAALRQFGIQVQCPTDHGYILQGSQKYLPQNVSVEGDWSQAAFPAVLGAIQGSVRIEGLDPASLQGDKVILDILQQAGATVKWEADGALVVQHASLRPVEVDLSACPDLGPVLCVLAAYLPGTSVIRNAGRLRIKESDRIASMEAELRKWGVDIASTEDTITVTGKSGYASDQPVTIDGHNDHRVVMAMTVFGLCAGSPTQIEGSGAVSKSWPDFFEDMKGLLQ